MPPGAFKRRTGIYIHLQDQPVRRPHDRVGRKPQGKRCHCHERLPLLPVHVEVLSNSIAISTKADPNGTLVVALRHPDPEHIAGTWLLTSWDAPPSSSEIECKEGIWAFP